MGETRRFMNMMRSHRRSPFTFSYILLPLCLCLLSVFSTQCLVLSQLQTEEYIPILVANPVVARAVNKLYILSGDANSAGVYTRIGQFMSLDLAIPWASTAPAWKRLADGPSNVNFPAAFSSNEQTLFVFQAQGANSPWSYKVQNGSWQKWDEIRHAGIEGVGAVMDPQTGAIYLAGGYNDTSIEMSSITYLDIFDPITQATQTLHLPDPNDVFFIRRNYGNVWSNYLRSILYWGGTNAVVNLHTPVSLTNQVTRLQTDIMDWSTMVIQGVAPSGRHGHCMTANDDGTKVVVYGGILLNGTIVGDLWVLDLITSTWAQGTPGPPRAGSACTIAGDQLLVWGGRMEQAGVPPLDMILYNLNSSIYTKQYTPPPYYKDLKPLPLTRTGPLSIHPSSVNGVDKGQTPPYTNLGRSLVPIGAVIGGVIGGLVLVGVIAAFFLIRKSRRLGQPRDNHGSKDMNLGGSRKWRGGFGRGRRNHGRDGAENSTKKDPQETGEDDELERTLQELVEQEKEIAQKRQMLVLQHQESKSRPPTGQKRGPTAVMDDKEEFIPLSPPPPQRFSPSTLSSVSCSAENLNDRRTVQAVSGPMDMYHNDSYVDDGPRWESGLAQDVIEPLYESSPTVSDSIPDLVYGPSPDVGMDWTKQQQGNHPHAIIEPSYSVTQH